IPTPEIIPAAKRYRYVRARDALESTPRGGSEVRALYSSIVAQLALRTLYVIFAADCATVETVVLNCVCDTIDPATGKRIRPCLLTIRVTRSTFAEIELARVEPVACVKGLNAQVSPSPQELQPVRPVVDFNMVDPRFVETRDVLSGLDQRPN